MRIKESALEAFLQKKGWKLRDLIVATYPYLSSDILYKVIKTKTRKPGRKVMEVLMKVTGMSFDELFEIEERDGKEAENVREHLSGIER